MTSSAAQTHRRPQRGVERGVGPGPGRHVASCRHPATGRSDTREAVAAQLAAMGCARYGLGVYDVATDKMIRRAVSADTVMTRLPFLKARNAHGCDIFIGPEDSPGVVLVDDVDLATCRRMWADGLGPAVVVQTSPGNHQAWVRLSATPIAAELATAAARVLAERYVTDPDSADWRHFGRLAGFTTHKPEHSGLPWHEKWVVLVYAGGGVARAGATILAEAGPLAMRSPVVAGPAAPFHAPQEASVRALTAAYQRALVEHRGRRGADDPSRLDMMVVREISVTFPQATAAELVAALKLASPDVEQRKRSHVNDYAWRTVRTVLRSLGRDPEN